MSWILPAGLSALFAGLTSILGKLGVRTVDSDAATALRTGVVLLLAWAVALASGSIGAVPTITSRAWGFLVASGLATGASWICYFRALSTGPVSGVTPIDKASTPLTLILAMLILGEDASALSLLAVGAYLLGTLLMVHEDGAPLPRRDAGRRGAAGPVATGGAGRIGGTRIWLPWALASAFFAALTSILGKLGVAEVPSDLATAIRTCVVLVMALGIVFVKGKGGALRHPRGRELGFLIASGLATGASWLFFYTALASGPASGVVPIDKLSILVSILFARFALKERLAPRAVLGLFLVVAATLVLAIR